MRALEFITGHVIYNPTYTYKFQLKTILDRIVCLIETIITIVSGIIDFTTSKVEIPQSLTL